MAQAPMSTYNFSGANIQLSDVWLTRTPGISFDAYCEPLSRFGLIHRMAQISEPVPPGPQYFGRLQCDMTAY